MGIATDRFVVKGVWLFGNPNLLGTGNFPPLGFNNVITNVPYGSSVLMDFPFVTSSIVQIFDGRVVTRAPPGPDDTIRILIRTEFLTYSVAWSDYEGLKITTSPLLGLPVLVKQSFASCTFFTQPLVPPLIDVNAFTNAVDETTFITSAANALHSQPQNAVICFSLDVFRNPTAKSNFDSISSEAIQEILDAQN